MLCITSKGRLSVSHASSFANRSVSIQVPVAIIPRKRSGTATKHTRRSVHGPALHRSRTMAPPRPEPQAWVAFEDIIRTSRSKFIALAYRILRNKEVADVAVQNAVVSAFTHLPSFEGRSALKTWFTRIVLNASLMLLRKRKPAQTEPRFESTDADDTRLMEMIPSSQSDPESMYARTEKFDLIEALLGELSPSLRKAFTMTYFDGLGSRQAGALLGVTAGTFKSRLFRARQYITLRTRRSIVTPIRGVTSSPYLRVVARDFAQKLA